nr:DUF4838 domain-containing protein [Clostridia bacterium]
MKKKFLAFFSFILSVIFVFSAVSCNESGSEEKVSDNGVYYGRTQIIRDGSCNLVENGTSEYKILLREDASKAENYAAQEFNRLLSSATGTTLPIVNTADLQESTAYISIGNTQMAAAAGETIEKNAISRNGFRLKSYKDGLLIVAGDNSGLIYGVYRFFEKNFNYMYYSPEEIKIDKSQTVGLLNFNFEDWPDFPERDVYNYTTKSYPAEVMRYFLNPSIYSKWDDTYGEGSWWSSLYDQSMVEQIVAYKDYGYEHDTLNNKDVLPEDVWYYGKGGDTNATMSQLCFTQALYSKGDLDPVQSGLMDADGHLTDDESFGDGSHGLFWTFCYNLIKNYISVETDKTLFQLGMSDNQDFCSCARCQTDISKYTRTGLVIRFANQVADVVKAWQEKNCPERTIYLTIFAYLTVIQPPVKMVNGKYQAIDSSVVVRDNIIVRYAPLLDGYLFPLLDETHNAGASGSIKGWKALAKNFAVWDYTANFREFYQPFTNWMAGYENLKSYYAYGFIDIFNQGNGSSTNLSFYYMDAWVRSRLLWDIHQDYHKLMDEFIDAYYGEGADHVRTYIEKLTFHYLNYMMPKGFSGLATGSSVTANINNYPLSVVDSVNTLFEDGINHINNCADLSEERKEIYIERLEYESVFFRYLELSLYSDYLSRAEFAAKIDDFERICRRGNLGGLTGDTTIYDEIALWKAAL